MKHKIFLFLDELNGFKEILYNSFKENIGRNGSVDVFFHHFNISVYKNIINESRGNYTSYVIMPISQNSCTSILKSIPEGKLYILDIGLNPYGKKYPSVCQNFEKDIISSLTSGLDLLLKYEKLILVYPESIKTQQGMIKGFNYFCKQHNFAYEQIDTASGRELRKGECYLVIYDNDLVNLVNMVRSRNFELGVDIGIISHDDTPLKSIVCNGITTTSTDFALMGSTMADMVINRKNDKIENPCYLIRRGSL
jgi:DNA-binding LacI/PurR family transcriptional regulator